MNGFLTRQTLLEATWRRLGDSRGCYRRRCVECGHILYASRPEAQYCRPACRQRAYRRRVRFRRESALMFSAN
ncbi:MAG TPA: hypothetical protein PLL20_13930 [Phycisphaerae bacterium]|nr:hypothetical protein [Phycisphaerae bacterium]HRR86023.1 hypothetical protein [Phycisphaerae bacterium]